MIHFKVEKLATPVMRTRLIFFTLFITLIIAVPMIIIKLRLLSLKFSFVIAVALLIVSWLLFFQVGDETFQTEKISVAVFKSWLLILAVSCLCILVFAEIFMLYSGENQPRYLQDSIYDSAQYFTGTGNPVDICDFRGINSSLKKCRSVKITKVVPPYILVIDQLAGFTLIPLFVSGLFLAYTDSRDRKKNGSKCVVTS